MRGQVINFEGLEVQLYENTPSREASNYIVNNYRYICEQVRRMRVPEEVVSDLVHDVLISVIKAENNGEGYNPNAVSGMEITVEEFVFGRLKGYSLNRRYHNNLFEYRQYRSSGDKVLVMSSSTKGDEQLNQLDSFQRAYALASVTDNLDVVELEMSLRSNIEYCRQYNDEIGFDILNLFRHFDSFVNLEFSTKLFDRLKEQVKKNKEFAEALDEIFKCVKVGGNFDYVVANF